MIKPQDRIVFDVETAALPGVTPPYAEPALGNLKDPLKIEAKRREAQQRATQKQALDPRYAMIVAYAVCTIGQDTTGDHDGDYVTNFAPIRGPGSTEQRQIIDNEPLLIRSLLDRIGDNAYATYNGVGFDVPFLIHRALAHGISPIEITDFARPWDCINPYTSRHLDIMLAIAATLPGTDRGGTPASGIPNDLKTNARAMLGIECPYDDDLIDKADMLGAMIDNCQKVEAVARWDAFAAAKLMKRLYW